MFFSSSSSPEKMTSFETAKRQDGKTTTSTESPVIECEESYGPRYTGISILVGLMIGFTLTWMICRRFQRLLKVVVMISCTVPSVYFMLALQTLIEYLAGLTDREEAIRFCIGFCFQMGYLVLIMPLANWLLTGQEWSSPKVQLSPVK